MKKKVLSLLLVGAMAASMLVGCGGNPEGESKPSNSSQPGSQSEADSTPESQGADSEGEDSQGGSAVDGQAAIDALVQATEGTVHIDLWCSETTEYQTVMAEIVEDFKATYPDVTFDIVIGAQSEAQAKDRVLEDPEASADVYVFAGDQLTDLVTAKALQSVDATYTYDPAEANGQTIVDAASVDGKLYAYPLTASNGYFLYYNSEILSEADVASWESMIAKLEEQDKQVAMQLSADGAWYIWGFFAGAGLVTTRNADNSTTCEWNNETGVATANAVYNIASSDAFLAAGSTSDIMSMLADGKIAAVVDGTWDSGKIQETWGDGYAAAKLPTLNVNGKDCQMASFAGYKFVGVSAYAENTGWSMLLAEFITNEASQKKIAAATGEGPANTAAAASIDSPALAALSAQSAYAYLEVDTVGGNYWSPAVSLAASLTTGEVADMQKLMDETVAGITAPVEAAE